MALEFIAVDPKNWDRRGQQMPISLSEHEILASMIDKLDRPLLKRLSDYWQEATYTSAEMNGLLLEFAELDKRALQLGVRPEIHALIARMLSVIRDAQARGFNVATIAD